MPTLYLAPRHSPESTALIVPASSVGWSVRRLQSYEVPPDALGTGGAFYGETLFGYAVAHQLGIELLEVPHDWLPGLPEEHRQRSVRLCTLRDAGRYLHAPRFVKCVGEKSFAAAVFDDLSVLAGQDFDQMVLAQEPVRFEVEYRAFVHNRHPVAMAVYARDGRPENMPKDAEEQAGAAATLGRLLADPRVELPAGVVVDVGLIEGRGWAVVEANPAWGSALYGCSPAKAMPAILASCGH